MSLPARGGTTLSRLRRNAGKGGRALTPARTHTLPAATPARTRLPPPAPRRAPNAEAEWPRAARGPAERRMAPNCHPPAGPGHSLPRRHTPLASPHAPLIASHFPPTPSLDAPHTRHPAPSQGGRSPGSGRESTEFNDTLGFLFSPFSP